MPRPASTRGDTRRREAGGGIIMHNCVYVLKLANNRTYTGSTDNVEKRLKQHLNGEVYSTKNKLPAELIYTEKFNSLEEARYMEKYYKSCAGRKKLRVILENIL
jgi:putative endonuclease